MIDNQVVLNKADMVVNSLSTGGALAPAQSKFFIQTLIDQSVIMPMMRVIGMENPEYQLDKIKFGERVLRAGAEARALTVAERAKPDTDRETLLAKLFKAEVRLSAEVLEDSIERKQLRSTVMQILGKRIALDMDELAVNSDTTLVATDVTLAQFDGCLKSATAHQVSANRNPVSKSILRNMVRAMPTAFRRKASDLRIFMSLDSEVDYRDGLSSRETPLGDLALGEEISVAYHGIPIEGIPVFPEKLGGGQDQQDALLTDPKNMAIGIHRELQFETMKDISAGVFVIVATIRFDFKYVEKDATVLATDFVHAN